ncbi:MAG TPA: bifunctional homocysteine S-methyltransferase/methylenetetrahydrofolate reductase, partial [Limnochordia bacterium]
MSVPVDHPFLASLAQRTLLADGAMGTLLLARGAAFLAGFERLNLEDRARVEAVHLDYIGAGAEVIRTNTFGANRIRLAEFGLEAKVWELNVWGVKIARQAREVSGRAVFVAGSIGPLGRPLAPLGPLSPAEASAAFKEQIDALLAGGVDLFIIETMADPAEAALAIEAARAAADLPVVATFSFSDDGRTLASHSPRAAAMQLAALGDQAPDVIGLNCGVGPALTLDMLNEMRQHLPLQQHWAALPNAGLPSRVGGRLLYGASPAYFAAIAPRFLQAGARLIGGCCGTTPEHIAAMRQALRQAAEPERRPDGGAIPPAAPGSRLGVRSGPEVLPGEARKKPATPAGAFGPRLCEKLGRSFVISVELDPPKGTVPEKFLQAAAALGDAGVDAINVADSPMARVRMGAIAGAHLIQSQTGVETIVHFTTRDRNLMGIQSDLLGAHALGIQNILALTGDPPSLGNVTKATGVYDVDSIGLLHILRGLNRGIDVGGNAIGEPTHFTVACALSPNAPDLDLELERFEQKLAAGVDFVMTQPLYELAPLERVLDRLGGVPAPILLGVMPLHSFKHAEYLHHEVPGITIPAAVREALRRAGSEGLRVGLEQAESLVHAARPIISGIYIVLSFGKYHEICAL